MESFFLGKKFLGGLDLGGWCVCLREIGHLESSCGAANGRLEGEKTKKDMSRDGTNGNLGPGGFFKSRLVF